MTNSWQAIGIDRGTLIMLELLESENDWSLKLITFFNVIKATLLQQEYKYTITNTLQLSIYTSMNTLSNSLTLSACASAF